MPHGALYVVTVPFADSSGSCLIPSKAPKNGMQRPQQYSIDIAHANLPKARKTPSSLHDKTHSGKPHWEAVPQQRNLAKLPSLSGRITSYQTVSHPEIKRIELAMAMTPAERGRSQYVLGPISFESHV